jgi:hypothetical protein
MDGVWLPAGEETPAARGLPDSRHTPRPGIAKGVAFSPLARPANGRLANRPSRPGRNRTRRYRPLYERDAAASIMGSTLGFAQLSPTLYLVRGDD